MKITTTQRFRDGRTTYEQGEDYEVPDLDGARFVGHGWATSPDYSLPGEASAVSDTVDIQPGTVTHGTVAKKVR